MNEITLTASAKAIEAYTVDSFSQQMQALEIWKRTVIVDRERGRLYASAEMSGMQERPATMLADKDGCEIIAWKGHYYVPVDWIIMHCPMDTQEASRTVLRQIFRDFFPNAIEVPTGLSFLGLVAGGSK